MQRTYTPTADGLSHARAREGGGYPEATGTARAFTYGRAETVGQTTVTRRYIYDGWNRIVEYENSGTDPYNTFTWGLDLSGTMQGTGGVGGLLATCWVSATNSPTYYPQYDGNGNITEYLESDGDIVAHFEYDPYGTLTRRTGTVSEVDSIRFEYRFSTKPRDPDTGLYYYGYRWYDPLTGRWPSRDPIGEQGGLNLYGFLGNDTIAYIDWLGFDSLPAGWRHLPVEEMRKLLTAEELVYRVSPRINGVPNNFCDWHRGGHLAFRPGLAELGASDAIHDCSLSG